MRTIRAAEIALSLGFPHLLPVELCMMGVLECASCPLTHILPQLMLELLSLSWAQATQRPFQLYSSHWDMSRRDLQLSWP